MPEPPEWLSDEARGVWDALPSVALEIGTTDELVVYCCAVADFERAQRSIDQTGVVIRGARGGVVRNPLNIVKAENAAVIRQMARRLGLVPAAGPEERVIAPSGYRNQAATERTITALRQGGRLEEVDAASCALARHLARALDIIDPAKFPAQTASLARTHLHALRNLRGIDDTERDDPGISDLLAALSGPVGDAEDAESP